MHKVIRNKKGGETKANVPVLPKRFLVEEADGTYVLQIRGAEVIKTKVQTGLVGTNGQVEILSGIAAGTEVLLP